ncbi:MAG: hypothetical protein GY898_00640 [Proteobacteria bacterium]|nr:hypothetical protein [Pseudomonadota bacterium]
MVEREQELNGEDLESSMYKMHAQASSLHTGATIFVWTAMLGLGGVFAVMFYLWRDWKLGWNVHPAMWEPLAAAFVGVAIGLGTSMPFAIWLRLQANLVHVQLSMERNTRQTSTQAESTARSIRELADAGMSGEWRVGMGSSDRLEVLGPIPGIDADE